jgi:hypothetical protein
MTRSRRTFLKAGLVAATVFAVTPVKNAFTRAMFDDGPPVLDDPLAGFSKSAFASYVNSIFQIQATEGSVDVSLVRVDDLPAPTGGECFSLVFRGGSEPLKQDTYAIEHSALGNFQLLLVPGGTSENGACEYTATINRLSPAAYANITVPTRQYH